MTASLSPHPPHRVQPSPGGVVRIGRGAKFDVYIGRPGIWGNPFVIGRDGTRLEVLRKWLRWFPSQRHLVARVAGLRGKVLGCHCDPLPCHGRLLQAMANGEDPWAVLADWESRAEQFEFPF